MQMKADPAFAAIRNTRASLAEQCGGNVALSAKCSPTKNGSIAQVENTVLCIFSLIPPEFLERTVLSEK
jgi:hypothetical protein